MLALRGAMSATHLLADQHPSPGFKKAGAAHAWDSSGQIRFALHDPLDHPFYWWPRTLLSYPIEFRQPVSLDQLILTDAETGNRIPLQFSDILQGPSGVASATLNFFADLPSGARREFVLTSVSTPVPVRSQVSETREGNSIVLDSGAMRVRIPATQQVTGKAPGPIMQVARGAHWVGSSSLAIDSDRITHISARRAAKGPLFLEYELMYESAGGSRYVATIRCEAGMDFVRLAEDMNGLRPGAHGALRTTWTGFDPMYRQAPNHPFPLPDKILSYDDYGWERIDAAGFPQDVRFGSSRPIYPEKLPDGELPMILGIYQPAPGNFRIGTWANFWNQQSGDALGVFIDDVTAWQDHEYAYEVESPALQVCFFRREGEFYWEWPLTRGRRSTCIAFYDHAKDKEAMHELERDSLPIQKDGLTFKAPLSFTSHVLWLQNRYGTLDLNMVKDWVLEYPEHAAQAPVIFTDGSDASVKDLEKHVLSSPLFCTLPITGTRQMDGHGPIPGRSIVNFSPVPTRQIMGNWIDGFNRLQATMTAAQRARLTAAYLLMSYVLGSDSLIPVVPMLGGHPNFLADVKSASPAMAFLFPEHPMASTWANMWEKCMELNTRFNTRPDVKTWDAHGGRWTEDLGTYVWAFLRPALRTDFLLQKRDGIRRLISPQLAQMADWLVNSLSAPFDGETEAGYRTLLAVDHGREWGVVGPGQGPQRVYTPLGAHSELRMTPRSLWFLGASLRQYAPLAAEHAMWAARPSSQDVESKPGNPPPWDDIMYRVAENRGTNPRLRSRKYTGYGIILRAAVDTPQEISVHLQQIDEGPNYRWGWAAQGGCGVLYFFAAGKCFSFNGPEDTGDRRDQDTDFCTTFGVFKDGEFRAIGQNVLSRPLYDLGAGQFAEIVPRPGADAYASPEYVSRSVLLAGHDYFVLYDDVLNESTVNRLSWFVRRGSELPSIQFARGRSAQDRETQRTDHQTEATTGVWFDGVGDSMAVVSHRNDLTVDPTDYGCRVYNDTIDDLVFRNPDSIHFKDGETCFDGSAGLIRRTPQATEFALFHGTRIGAGGFVFTTTDTDLGIGGTVTPGKPVRGVYFAPKPTTVTISVPSSAALRFHIDGEAQPAHAAQSAMTITLPAGRHEWELTDGLPVPIAPRILRTENFSGGAQVMIGAVAAAAQYRVEMSRDNGLTWSRMGAAGKPSIEVHGLTDGEKIHLRAVALNAGQESAPGAEYPLYVSADPPLPPDGVRVELADGSATISWGEVLGVTEYRLYARTKEQKAFQVIYRGLDRSYVDRRAGIRACDEIPAQANQRSNAVIVEYCVAAVNGNGEGAKSRIANTDPACWRNWDPRPGEPFRRVYSFAPGSPASANSPRYYPE